MDTFKIKPYLGKWYVIGTLPISTHNNTIICYTLNTELMISLTIFTVSKDHECIRKKQGFALWNNNIWHVSFTNTFSTIPNYIIYDTDYKYWALIEVPHKHKVLILCRQSSMNIETYSQLISQCEKLNYNVDAMNNELNLIWTRYNAKIVNKYFSQPYTVHRQQGETIHYVCRYINNEEIIIHRPNHGLVFGMIQGFLALETINNILSTNNSEDNLCEWIKSRMKNDVNFKRKLQYISSFQRTGRMSETSETANPQLYLIYEHNDVRNYVENTTAFNDLIYYKDALLWQDNNNNDIDIINTRKILKIAHLLELRRMSDFDKHRIFQQISDINNYVNIEYLWYKTGIYLSVTGMTNMEPFIDDYADIFFELSLDPDKLSSLLHNLYINF